jgi:hypothetical protein
MPAPPCAVSAAGRSRCSRVTAAPHLPACAGGSLNWAWDANKFGWPLAVDLTDAVSTWSASRQLDPPPSMGWASPADAPLLTFAARFVDAVLKLGTNVERPSDGLLSYAAFNAKCSFIWSDMEALNLSVAFVLSSCVPFDSFVLTKEQAEDYAARSVSELVAARAGDVDCYEDLLRGLFSPYGDVIYMGRLVEALPQTDGSCAGGCPFDRPLCDGTTCVRPTCDDFMPLCNAAGNAGALARFVCGVTCGCNSTTSSLFWVGPNSGCSPACQETARSAARTAVCSDAQPGSAEFAAYSLAREPYNPDGVSTTVRAALGCFSSNFDGSCYDYDYFTSQGMKSLVPFCPVTCGCIDDPSIPGCPGSCNATDAADSPPPVCRDLSDAQLLLASDARVAQYGPGAPPYPYPPSCSGANATVCAYLGIDPYGGRLRVWEHPCPVACNACLCRDLSDAELVLASVVYKLRPNLYPPSCVGANATVCARLGIYPDGSRRPAWEHPCPVACQLCLDARIGNATSENELPDSPE